MARFTFKCGCGYETIIESFGKPSTPICIMCDKDMERVINPAQTMLKGASSDNDFYVAPSNAELGLPSEYTNMKESTKSADAYLDSESKEEKRELDRAKAERARERERSAEKIKQKYPDFYNKFKAAEEKIGHKQRNDLDRRR
jgi:hypothetical protein